MHAGAILSLIGLNCIILAGFLYLQSRVMDRQLRNLKSEIQELEDLVAAILEEFEEVAGSLEKQSLAPQEIGEEPSVRKAQILDTMIPDENPHEQQLEDVKLIPSFQGPAEEPKPNYNPSRSQTTDPRHLKILELWNNGNPVEEIARQLGTGKGEVQLVLGIYHKI